MKKLALAAALGAALTACGDAAEESDEPVAVETPAATETVAAAETAPGTYEFDMEGTATVATLNADGTYTDAQGGDVIESGTWENHADGKTCFDPEGDDTPATCYTISASDADGTFTATPDNGGDPLTISKTG
jgi:hypothetical protein